MNVLITGAAGYIGTLLTERLARSDHVDTVFGIDLNTRPALLDDCAKVRWINADVAEDRWLAEARDAPIDVVIHCAYRIREMYASKRKQQERWNIEGARKVFDFALTHPSAHRLVHFSTVSGYGALPTNSIDRPLQEDDPLCEDSYLYGV